MAFNPKKQNKVLVEEAVMNLKDPETGVDLEFDDKPITFTIYGAASPKHRKAVDVLQAKKKKRGNRDSTLEEGRADSIEFLVALSKETSNYEDDDGKPVNTAEQFKEIYSNEELAWIRDQVSIFAAEQTNFLQK